MDSKIRNKKLKDSTLYLLERADDNYQRFLIVPIITGGLALLFISRNLFVEYFESPSRLFTPFILTWSILLFVSVLFRLTLPKIKQMQNIKLLDVTMFGFATAMCMIAATLSALSSSGNSDFTAYAYTILGTATTYRSSKYKYLAIMAITLLYFNLIYSGLLDHPFSLGFQLPIFALSVLSMFIACSLESNRKRMMELSRELERTNARLKEETIRDPLTKLYNRRYLTDFIQRELNEFQRTGAPFCLALCDIDHFKKINDSLGHLVGDKVLVQFADILRQTTRSTDMLIRYGGEEFVIVMPRTSLSTAQNVIERTRQNIEAMHFEGVDWTITTSFGVAEVTRSDTDNRLLARADHLLYQAKSQGRNLVILEPNISNTEKKLV